MDTGGGREFSSWGLCAFLFFSLDASIVHTKVGLALQQVCLPVLSPWCAVHLAQSSSSLAESFLLIRVYLLTVGQLYQGTA